MNDNNIKSTLLKAASGILALAGACVSCTGFLESLPDGSYNSQNVNNYPEIVKGYVDAAYNLLPSYKSDVFLTDIASDDMMCRDESNWMHMISVGSGKMSAYGLESNWADSYKALNYVNTFLEDNIGYNTKYLVDVKRDSVARKCLQGDAYGIRAWLHFSLLKEFAGVDVNGDLLGIPLKTTPTDYTDINVRDIRRATFDETVQQILQDCDSALVYLPMANRDFALLPDDPTDIEGGVRYRKLDCISIYAIKALTYLLWASPAYNSGNDTERWTLAAENAAKVMDWKLTVESAQSGGFNVKNRFSFTDPNDPGAIWISNAGSTTTFETSFYPDGFHGKASYVPTQNLVDAFPMANGYPISDIRSGYDPTKPYEGRDPRFYATIFYDGANVVRPSNSEVMYTFDTKAGGKDAAGGINASPSGYYIKKHIYLGWNYNDPTVQSATHCKFFLRWQQMCLCFAEAANHSAGPMTSIFGHTAREALGYIRAMSTTDNVKGIGYDGSDPYLDECAAAGEEAFDALVRNEWRLTTCFEGERIFHLFRWAVDLSDINVDIRKAVITESAPGIRQYDFTQKLCTRNFATACFPIPYYELRRMSQMTQNAGWESWK